MKYATLFLVSLFLLGSVGANASPATINLQGTYIFGGEYPVFSMSFPGGGFLCVNNAPTGLAFASCSSAQWYNSGLNVTINIVPGPASSSTGCGGPSDCTLTQYPSAVGSYTISFTGGAPGASPDPLGNAPLITGSLDASGEIAWSQMVPEYQSIGFSGTMTVSTISPELLTDLGLGTVQSGWTGTFSVVWADIQGGGGTSSFALSAPDPPSPAPESGTLILLGLGLAASALAFGRDGRRAITRS